MKHRQWIYRWISSRSISVQNCLIRGEIEIKIGVVFILFADNNNDNNLISIQSKEYEKKAYVTRCPRILYIEIRFLGK